MKKHGSRVKQAEISQIIKHGRRIEIMASRASVAKRIKKKNLPKIEPDIYSTITLNNLVVYAVHYLQEYGVTATVEEIVSICFRLFPQSFALRNYPRWPDSALVIRRLKDGRGKKLIKGNPMDGFSLRYKGRLFAKKVAMALGLIQPAPAMIKKKNAQAKKKTALIKPVEAKAKRTKVVSQKKRREIIAYKVTAPEVPIHVSKEEKLKAGKFVHLMENSDAYINYKKNGNNPRIGEFDFRSLLLCTMESSRETLVKNVGLFKGFAKIHNHRDLLSFLNHCEDRFSYLLVQPQKRLKKPVRKSNR